MLEYQAALLYCFSNVSQTYRTANIGYVLSHRESMFAQRITFETVYVGVWFHDGISHMT